MYKLKTAGTLLLSFLFLSAQAQSVSDYFEKIRNNEAALTAFFAQMPKGGDLHHHYSGSVYTETYVNRVVDNDYYINKRNFIVTKEAVPDDSQVVRFSELGDSLPYYRQQLMKKWSVKDYNGLSYPSDKQFFETFPNFEVASDDSLKQGLLELKQRAIKEHVRYIETMFVTIPYRPNTADIKKYNNLLLGAQEMRDEQATQALLGYLFDWYQRNNMRATAQQFNAMLTRMHREAALDDEDFMIRYQNYVVRVLDPLQVFQSLIVSFESANRSPLIVGVNIVAPENNEVSMRDYWLHMQMYKFCSEKYPDVQYSMHAGELVLGMVQPEELTWHINEAVHTASPDRIGHGVDLAYEQNSYDLLRYMAENDIAVEINLTSNEFILKVAGGEHPITLYDDFGVPMVISTDDAGVLRSSLIHQFVLLAKRYPRFSYRDIKGLVYNSIRYSFIEEPYLKEQLMTDLDCRFDIFEEKIRAVARK